MLKSAPRSARPIGPVLALLLVTGLAAALPPEAGAQQRRLTIDELYDPHKKIDFTGAPARGFEWIDDGAFLWPRQAAGDEAASLLRVDALSGKTTPFLDSARMEKALAAMPGIEPDEARRLSGRTSYTMNAARTALLLTIGGDLYHYDIAAGRASRLTSAPGEPMDPAFSPDGRLVAFTRDHDLYVVEVASGRERRLTTDGGPKLLNGRLDWVYQEEIYGRGQFRAFWWSPDSARLAFLQLDQHLVPTFTLVDHIPLRQEVETFEYPKPGDPNPRARLGVVRASGGPVQWIDTAKYSAQEHLIVDVAWSPDARRVVHQVQDREQTWLDLNAADPRSGATQTLFRETTRAWVDRHESPRWLKDGSFLWFSERTGWKHLYHYSAEGTLVRPVTSGEWETRVLHGIDEAGGWVYFGGTERSPIGADLYRVRLDGTGLERLSKAEGTHTGVFNPSLTLYLGTWSTITTPPQVRLHRAGGAEVRLVHETTIPALADYGLSRPEFVQVPARDGFVMEALLIKPPDFDPARRYPVYQHTYAGPHAQQVRNAWGGITSLYHQMLAQRGIVVWVCDNRSASGKGAQSAWSAYLRLGESELQDIEDCLGWLKQQPWVDASRIGLNGWSYGGFMVSYALTHSKSFAMGIAGGSVTDWTLYDTIYTERFMRMPQNNPDGYRRTSPLQAAANLHGALLLVHGTMDDNVHLQNTVRFAYELQKAGKPFELMLYPRSQHGISDPALVRHMRQTMFDFILRHLRPEEGAGSTGTRP
jgi:dipeptidyl-peptidase 4